MKNQIDPIVEIFDLENSECANEWMYDNGKIKDIEKFHKYLTETFENPLYYVLETMNEYLIESK